VGKAGKAEKQDRLPVSPPFFLLLSSKSLKQLLEQQ
jgi:hypothetical protein